ncbi:MAG TPA: hypothetical protein VFT53_05310 [Candidatus Saccharimonadales bacterium]|nr:hypothetical protein [Candidatus Saccharimonadales bacterium]
MNNPNFRSLGEAGGDYLPDESNDGALAQDKSKTKKSKTGRQEDVASEPVGADSRRTEVMEWFRRRASDEGAKKEAHDEAVIYSSKEEKQQQIEDEQADETPENSDFTAEYVELDAAERQEVVEAYIEARSDVVQTEGDTPAADSVQTPVVAANQAFLRAARRELHKPVAADTKEDHVEQAVTTAFEDVEQQIATGVDLQEIAEDDAAKQPLSSEAAAPGSMQYEDVESSDTQSLAAYAAAQAPHAHAAGSGMPPQYVAYAASGNVAPQPGFAQAASGNLEPAAPAERRLDVADWFVPAAAAYLWGRHNGRKKAERRLLPQQKKLETTVRELVSEVAAKEARIRQLARQQAELRAAQAVQATPVAAPNRAPQPLAEHPLAAPATSIADRYRVAETPAPQLVAEQAPLRAPERPAAAMPEATVPVLAPRAEAPVRPKTPPEVMNHQELLAASAEIFIGSVDLKSIYEDNKVSEEGLRRLVIEHAHGGDIRSILKDEMLKHEMKYELDPMQQDEQSTPEAAPIQRPQAPMLPPWLMDSLPIAPPQILATPPSIQPPEPLAPPARPKRTSGIISTQTRRTVQPVLAAANAIAFTLLVILLAVLLFIWLR